MCGVGRMLDGGHGAARSGWAVTLSRQSRGSRAGAARRWHDCMMEIEIETEMVLVLVLRWGWSLVRTRDTDDESNGGIDSSAEEDLGTGTADVLSKADVNQSVL